MEYIARYGLEFNPFIKNSKDILVETQDYREAMVRLDYLKSTKGFGLLTGAPGRGKTTIGEPHEKWTALYSLSDKCRIAGGQNSSKKRTEILL